MSANACNATRPPPLCILSEESTMCARRRSALAINSPLACSLDGESCTVWDSTLRIPKPASGLPVRSRMRKSLSLLMVQCHIGCGKFTSLATDAVDDAIPMPLQMVIYLSLGAPYGLYGGGLVEQAHVVGDHMIALDIDNVPYRIIWVMQMVYDGIETPRFAMNYENCLWDQARRDLFENIVARTADKGFMNEHVMTRGDKRSALTPWLEAVGMQDRLGGCSTVESDFDDLQRCAFDMKEGWDVQAPS
ncbi:hypothetical protein F5X97DRAFT_327386 [Nemania serpens]|nr:hypothetical protein F5X97DRAFT_327386 [Nemania serpens]